MNISAKTEYACIAVLELASQFESGKVVRIREIADRHGIPSRFLVQILLQLKSSGLVSSTRGAAGGYRLQKSPADVTLYDVMAVIEGSAQPIEINATRQSALTASLVGKWQEIADSQAERLQATTFADLVQDVRRLDENMYYI